MQPSELCASLVLGLAIFIITVFMIGRRRTVEKEEGPTVESLKAEAAALQAEADELYQKLLALDATTEPEVKLAIEKKQLSEEMFQKRRQAQAKRNHAANLKFFQDHVETVRNYLIQIEDAVESVHGPDARIPVDDDGGGPAGGTVEGRVDVKLDRHGFTIVKQDYIRNVTLGPSLEKLKHYLETRLDEDDIDIFNLEAL